MAAHKAKRAKGGGTVDAADAGPIGGTENTGDGSGVGLEIGSGDGESSASSAIAHTGEVPLPVARAAIPSEPTSTHPPAPTPPTEPSPVPVPDSRTKSRADKLRELHIRKVRMTATPLDPRSAPALASASSSTYKEGERRYFEWTTASPAEVRAWQEQGSTGGTRGVGGKWSGVGKVYRAWVPAVCP